MSKHANPTLIGAFVIGAIAVLAIGVTVFGGSEYFKQRTRFVSYFDGSVQGLRVGANVVFRGVRVGFVQDIDLLADVTTLEPSIQVTMEILADSLILTRGGRPIAARLDALVTPEQLIERGLRARLVTESFVTGQLLVELDYLPGTPVILRGEAPPYPEIPTVPNDVQQTIQSLRQSVADFLEAVDVEDLARRLNRAARGADELLNSADLRASLAGLNRLVNAPETQALSARLQRAMDELDQTLADTRRLVNDADLQLDPLAGELRATLARLNDGLNSATATLDAAKAQIRGETELAYELGATLSEVRDAARSLRLLSDYLERHPEALLRGKQR
ncbi:MAG: MCE family protein [Gammaproteobacteria bacterium]|nr:MAG: MCE family protein [Gammaproteobacteria bacterium]